MTRSILHVSDLHFGRDRPELLGPLTGTINRLEPDLVAISGDFTQRARIGQFQAARLFLDALDPPWLAVPGNHDTPLDNLFVRLLRPWHRYRCHILDNLAPVWTDDEIAVANTANPFSWQRGRVTDDAVDRLCGTFDDHERGRMHVAVLHHPLEHGPDIEKRLMRGAREALPDAWGSAGSTSFCRGIFTAGTPARSRRWVACCSCRLGRAFRPATGASRTTSTS